MVFGAGYQHPTVYVGKIGIKLARAIPSARPLVDAKEATR